MRTHGTGTPSGGSSPSLLQERRVAALPWRWVPHREDPPSLSFRRVGAHPWRWAPHRGPAQRISRSHAAGRAHPFHAGTLTPRRLRGRKGQSTRTARRTAGAAARMRPPAGLGAHAAPALAASAGTRSTRPKPARWVLPNRRRPRQARAGSPARRPPGTRAPPLPSRRPARSRPPAYLARRRSSSSICWAEPTSTTAAAASAAPAAMLPPPDRTGRPPAARSGRGAARRAAAQGGPAPRPATRLSSLGRRGAPRPG